MKIKGSIEKIKPVHLFSVFVFALISCTALRFYHCLSYIDVTNGFYRNTDFTVVLFYVILIASGLFILAAGFLSASNREFNTQAVHSDKLLGFVSIGLGLSMLIESVYSIVLGSYSSGYQSAGFSEAMGSGDLPYSLLSFFSFLTAVYFFAFSVNCFRKKGRIIGRGIFSLLPVGWACTKMIPLFVKQISFTRVSDLVLEIALVSFFIMYTLSFAQCCSGVYADVAQWRMTAVGLVTALISLVLNLPKLTFTLIGKSEAYVTSGYPISYAELVFAVFILVLIFVTMKEKPEAPVTAVTEKGSSEEV